jgi:hypothetical protein
MRERNLQTSQTFIQCRFSPGKINRLEEKEWKILYNVEIRWRGEKLRKNINQT